MIFARISGTGSYLPDTVLENKAIEKQLDTTHEWIHSRTGIASRRIAKPFETTSYMAVEAAKNALISSKLDAKDIDMILVATCTPDHFFPSMACFVQYGLGIRDPIPAFDVSAACSGFIYASDVARQYIETGRAKHIMVVGSETMSKAIDWTDRSTCVLFGDGAAACVYSASTDGAGILASVLHAAHDSQQMLKYENSSPVKEDSFLSMRGSEVFKIAVNMMGDLVDEVLQKAHLTQNDIDWLIPHQANIRIINAIARKLHLPSERVIVTIEDQGNTSAASVPLALDLSIRQNHIKRGDKLLLEAFGGGLTWGAMIIEY